MLDPTLLGTDARYRYLGAAGDAQRQGDALRLARLLSTDYEAQHGAISAAWLKVGGLPDRSRFARARGFDAEGYIAAAAAAEALVAAEAFLRACVRDPSNPVPSAPDVLSPDGLLTTLGVASNSREPDPVRMPDWLEQGRS